MCVYAHTQNIYIYVYTQTHTHTHAHTHTHTHAHTHTHTHIYIYIYIYTNFVEHNRQFLFTYFLVDPFILPYCFYRIRWELIGVFSMIVYIPSTFCSTLGHHQGRIYYKSDVTFAFALQLCKSVCTIGVYSVCF